MMIPLPEMHYRLPADKRRFLTENVTITKHIMAPFEDLDLTFFKLKKILRDAARGELVGTEKLDGMKVFLTFRDGKAFAARNQNDILSGGLDLSALAHREFAGGEKIRNVYIKALQTFEQACKRLAPEDQAAIFGQDNPIFYNTEIISNEGRNVVNYDRNVLTIHDTGHLTYNIQDQRVTPVDVTNNIKFLDKIVDQTEQEVSGQNFSIKRDAVVKLAAIADDKDLEIALARINKIMSAGNVSDGQTIKDYLYNIILAYVEEYLVGLSPDIHTMVVNSLLGLPDGVKNLPKGLNPEVRQGIAVIIKSAKEEKLVAKALIPIEDAIHDFSVEMLKGLKSAFILDQNKELSRIKSQVGKAIKTIQNYTGPGREEAMEVLMRQLQKIKHVDNIATPSEGFVFNYGDKIYKFTGNFAPVNQILGLFKYGRDDIKIQEEEILDEQPKKKQEKHERTIAVIPGAFKPPHRGHLAMIKHYAKIADEVIILMSPLARTLPDGGEISFDQSRRLWELYKQAEGLSNVKILESIVNSPVEAAFQFFMNKNDNPNWTQEGDTIILGVSDKDNDIQRFRHYKEHTKPGTTVVVDPFSSETIGDDVMSATGMREAISNGDIKAFQQFLPLKLQNRAEEILSWFKPKSKKKALVEEILKEVTSQSSNKDPMFSQDPEYDIVDNIISEDGKKIYYYHGSETPLPIGKTIKARKRNVSSYYMDWYERDVERIRQQYFPDSPSRLDSFFLAKRPSWIRSLGGSDKYIYAVRPMDKNVKVYFGWIARYMYRNKYDDSTETLTKESYFQHYWAGKKYSIMRRDDSLSLPEFLTSKMEIVKCYSCPREIQEELCDTNQAIDLQGDMQEESLEPMIEQVLEYIRKKKDKHCVYSRKGKQIACHKTRGQAVRQLQAIEADKKREEEGEEDLEESLFKECLSLSSKLIIQRSKEI